jgi:hypothetical protein
MQFSRRALGKCNAGKTTNAIIVVAYPWYIRVNQASADVRQGQRQKANPPQQVGEKEKRQSEACGAQTV